MTTPETCVATSSMQLGSGLCTLCAVYIVLDAPGMTHSHIGLIVGVSLVVIILILLILFIFFQWRKRRGLGYTRSGICKKIEKKKLVKILIAISVSRRDDSINFSEMEDVTAEHAEFEEDS